MVYYTILYCITLYYVYIYIDIYIIYVGIMQIKP